MVWCTQVFGGDKNRTRKISELQHTVSALEASKEASKAEYNRVKSRNVSELNRYKFEKTNDFITMMVSMQSTMFVLDFSKFVIDNKTIVYPLVVMQCRLDLLVCKLHLQNEVSMCGLEFLKNLELQIVYLDTDW